MPTPKIDPKTGLPGAYIKKPKNMLEALGRAFIARAAELGEVEVKDGVIQWPCDKWRDDPVAFFREVLGVEPWSRQIDMINLIRDHDRVAVRSGHKVSKTMTIIGIALWYFCSFPDAHVVLTSTTSRQVDEILWLQLRMLHARAKIPIGGNLGEKARTGLKDQFRYILGFTARESEAVAGVSGENLFYLLDEASGIDKVIYEAIQGNRMGGAKVALFGNPTRTEGEFFDAFYGKKEFYKTLTISSEESPNVVQGRTVVKGLADPATIKEYEREHGRESAWFKIRILGQHVLGEDGKIISIHDITQAEERWHETPADGLLCIGVDPAGAGGKGDESAFAIRRGKKVIEIILKRGLNEDAHLAMILSIIQLHKQGDETPRVIIDSEGAEGARVYNRLMAEQNSKPEGYAPFRIVRMRSSEKAQREPQNYDRLREELWANLALWIREGGAIPVSTKLQKELHVPEWKGQIKGTVKMTSKDEFRKILGRSPDSADAVSLAVWEPTDHFRRIEEERQARQRDEQYEDTSVPVLDPYGALDAFRQR